MRIALLLSLAAAPLAAQTADTTIVRDQRSFDSLMLSASSDCCPA